MAYTKRLRSGFESGDGPFAKSENRYTIDEMRRFIATSHTIPAEMKHELEVSIAAKAPRENTFDDRAYLHGVFGGKHWAIKKDDLHLIETLAAAALAIASFLALAGSSPVILAVNLVFSALAITDRIRSKWTNLDPTQYGVIMILSGGGPITAVELAERMSGIHIFGNDVWTESRATEILTAMKAVHLHDGSTVELVTQASDGRWAANGI